MFRGGGPGRLWEETCIPKVVSSNPSTIYWMDIFHISRIVIFVWKYENKQKEAGVAHFYKNKYFSQKQLITSRKCTFSVTCQLHLLPGYCHKTLNTIGKFETTIEIVVFT